MMTTDETADEYLRQKMNEDKKKLIEEIEALHAHNSILSNSIHEWNEKHNALGIKFNQLQNENIALKEKLLQYEHESFRLDTAGDESIDIEYWSEENGRYEVFASFYFNELDDIDGLQALCEEILLMLKDTYVVE